MAGLFSHLKMVNNNSFCQSKKKHHVHMYLFLQYKT